MDANLIVGAIGCFIGFAGLVIAVLSIGIAFVVHERSSQDLQRAALGLRLLNFFLLRAMAKNGTITAILDEETKQPKFYRIEDEYGVMRIMAPKDVEGDIWTLDYENQPCTQSYSTWVPWSRQSKVPPTDARPKNARNSVYIRRNGTSKS